MHPAEKKNAVWVLPLPIWANQMIGKTILYIPLTVNRVLFFFQLNWDGVSHSSKIVCAWLLTNPVYFRLS